MGRGEGAVPTKGVGGYRPTTNWREISVRRRSVAARQVLACIIVSGVVIVAAGILLTVLGFLVIASQCPFMWREGAGSCYYLAPHNASWEEGRSYCTSQSAALLHLHSRTEADFITEVMSGRSWLGARRKRGRDNVWAWTDSGKALNYTRWTGSEPASLQQDLCAAVEPGGAWLAVACSDGDTAYVICDYVPGYNPSCWWDPWWRCAAWWCLCSAWRSASGGESSSPRTLRRSPTTRTTIDRWRRLQVWSIQASPEHRCIQRPLPLLPPPPPSPTPPPHPPPPCPSLQPPPPSPPLPLPPPPPLHLKSLPHRRQECTTTTFSSSSSSMAADGGDEEVGRVGGLKARVIGCLGEAECWGMRGKGLVG
ncbi:uncharacterized protein LOC123501191 isoform X2 [Portunus trituberculatus]|nr:uncharacterized protein LOC123501191 isoform X2 [Portunus trituberculatus]